MLRSRLARWAWIQTVKRSPINFRPILRIPKRESAKGLALCVLGYGALASTDALAAAEGERLVHRIIALRMGGPLPLWGYPFAWHGRSFFAPRGAPNLVVTAFVIEALLSVPGSELARQAVREACDVIVRRWPAVERHGRRCFHYTPHDTTREHNVKLLAAAQLARAGRRFGEQGWIDVAAACVAWALAAQRPDGSWAYGEDEPRLTAESHSAEDIHTATQAVLTPLALRRYVPDDMERARVAAAWMFRRFRLAPGRYLYQRGRLVQRRTLFLRWTQAWVFRALAELHAAEIAVARPPQVIGLA